MKNEATIVTHYPSTTKAYLDVRLEHEREFIWTELGNVLHSLL